MPKSSDTVKASDNPLIGDAGAADAGGIDRGGIDQGGIDQGAVQPEWLRHVTEMWKEITWLREEVTKLRNKHPMGL